MKNTLKKAIAILLAITTLISLCSCSVSGTTVNLEEYITVTFSTYNGYGSADLELDDDALEALIDSEKFIKFVNEVGETSDEAAALVQFVGSPTELFKVKLAEEYNNLSNGDKVKVVVESAASEFGFELEDVEKGLGISFSATELEFEVTGLKDVKTLNVFEGIEEYIDYNGSLIDGLPIDGEANPAIVFPEGYEKQIDGFYLVIDDYCNNRIKIVYNNEVVDKITYYVTGYNNLSNGDTFAVTVEGGSELKSMDYIIPERSKEYTVSGLPRYLASRDELTSEKLKEVKAEVLEYIKNELGGTKICEIYFYSIKPSSTREVKYGIIAIGDTTGSFLSGYKYIDVVPVIHADGTWEYSMYSGYYYDTVEDVYNECFDHNNYTFEKLA